MNRLASPAMLQPFQRMAQCKHSACRTSSKARAQSCACRQSKTQAASFGLLAQLVLLNESVEILARKFMNLILNELEKSVLLRFLKGVASCAPVGAPRQLDDRLRLLLFVILGNRRDLQVSHGSDGIPHECFPSRNKRRCLPPTTAFRFCRTLCLRCATLRCATLRRSDLRGTDAQRPGQAFNDFSLLLLEFEDLLGDRKSTRL